MTGHQMRASRKLKGWTQVYAAERLGVSQPYLSLLEEGLRPVPAPLTRKAVRMFDLAPTSLPLEQEVRATEDRLTRDLAALKYPGFSYLRSPNKRNPAQVLFEALSASDLDTRLTEAMPWLLYRYPALDWQWLVRNVKMNDLQNRLGFVTTLARQLAELKKAETTKQELAKQESSLEPSRLVKEDTLCHDSLSEAERRWLRKARTPEAAHWNLLTDLSAEQLVDVA